MVNRDPSTSYHTVVTAVIICILRQHPFGVAVAMLDHSFYEVSSLTTGYWSSFTQRCAYHNLPLRYLSNGPSVRTEQNVRCQISNNGVKTSTASLIIEIPGP